MQIILQELFETYGAVSNEQVKEEEAELNGKLFHTTQPPVNLYQAVKELNKLRMNAHCPYTEQQ